jgi:hypothetical protein
MTENVLKEIDDRGHGFQVISHVLPELFIELNGQTFVLTSMIEHVLKKNIPHFTILVNNEFTQKWTRIDDSECTNVISSKDFVRTDLSSTNVVGFVYQKLNFTPKDVTGIPLFSPNFGVQRSSSRSKTASHKSDTLTISIDYWEELRSKQVVAIQTSKKVKHNSGMNGFIIINIIIVMLLLLLLLLLSLNFNRMLM